MQEWDLGTLPVMRTVPNTSLTSASTAGVFYLNSRTKIRDMTDGTSKTALASEIPLQTTGQARDITQAALYLLSSQYVTGQTLYVDGGRHMEGDLYG